jgi:cytochrome c553
VALLALSTIAAACAVPGRLYPVAPAISGALQGRGLPSTEGRLVLVLMHRESPSLHDRIEQPLRADGAFAFEPISLAVAGHEFSKVYRVYLHLRDRDRDRVVWRAQFSRYELAGPIRLDCDLDRPIEQGQPCQVSGPTAHPWLVSEGKRAYDRLCASCHGRDGRGDGTGAPAAEGAPSALLDLTRVAERRGGRFDRAEVAEWIEGRKLPPFHGTRTMPIWGERLSSEFERYAEGDELIGATLDPVMAYLEALQRRE